MLNIDCFARIAPVAMDVNYGRSLRATPLTYVGLLRGAVASLQFGTYRIPHTVICCLFSVNACLSSMNFVVVQSALRAHACRMSPSSLLRSHHIA